MSIRERLRGLFSRAKNGRPEPSPPEDGGATEEELVQEYVVTNDLDLHGFFPEQIPEVMEEFLAEAVRRGIGEVRIAHGKGRSVLRREVWAFLEKDRRVAEFRQAPPGRGGWGATIARLKG